MKRLVLILCLVPFLFACAANPNQPIQPLQPAQEDALALLAGNGLAVAMKAKMPETIPLAQAYCQRFSKADITEAKVLLDAAFTYLFKRLDSSFAPIVENAMQVIGIGPEQITLFINTETDAMVEIEGFSEEMFRKAQLVISGFCQVI